MKQLLSKVCNPVGRDGIMKCRTTKTVCPKCKDQGLFDDSCFAQPKIIKILISSKDRCVMLTPSTASSLDEIGKIIRTKLEETCIFIDPPTH